MYQNERKSIFHFDHVIRICRLSELCDWVNIPSHSSDQKGLIGLNVSLLMDHFNLNRLHLYQLSVNEIKERRNTSTRIQNALILYPTTKKRGKRKYRKKFELNQQKKHFFSFKK